MSFVVGNYHVLLDMTSIRHTLKKGWPSKLSSSEILSSATTSHSSRPPVREKSSKQLKATLKNNCSLFSRLYIASQVRNGDLDEFFKHENLACPPEISHMGVLRNGTKSDLLSCLQDLMPVSESVTVQVTCTTLDGAAIIKMLQSGTTKTFHDYA